MVVVGADVHKRTHTFVAVDEVGAQARREDCPGDHFRSCRGGDVGSGTLRKRGGVGDRGLSATVGAAGTRRDRRSEGGVVGWLLPRHSARRSRQAEVASQRPGRTALAGGLRPDSPGRHTNEGTVHNGGGNAAHTLCLRRAGRFALGSTARSVNDQCAVPRRPSICPQLLRRCVLFDNPWVLAVIATPDQSGCSSAAKMLSPERMNLG